jgi:Protein of unknown function (DUF4058)
MPIHDWTRVSAGTFHDFHQDWVIEIRRTLNRGVLPPGFYAMTDQRVSGPEPDIVARQLRGTDAPGGVAVLDAPPRAQQSARVETEREVYARRANRLVVHDEVGRVVAIIEVVSPGNKDTRHAIASFVRKAVDFLHNGINVVVIDLFPPTPRDPDGVHRAIWNELTDEPFAERPANKPLTVAGYDAGDPLVAYVDTVAVGDALPDAALFLAPGWYVNIPLDATYNRSWEETPQPIRALVAPPA